MDPLTRDPPERPARDRQLAPYGYCRYCGAPRNQGARFCGGLECVRLGDADRAAATAAATLATAATAATLAATAPPALELGAAPESNAAIAAAADVGRSPAIEAVDRPPVVAEEATILVALAVGEPELPAAGDTAAGLQGIGAAAEGSQGTRFAAGWLLVAPIEDGSSAVAPLSVVGQPAHDPTVMVRRSHEPGWEPLTPLEPQPERPMVWDRVAARSILVRPRRGARGDAEFRVRLVRDTSVLLIIGSLAAYLTLSLLPVGSHPHGGVLGATSAPVVHAAGALAPVGLPSIGPAVGSPPSH
jgi:hypothetical protein